jgi:hypothetical protein
MNKEMKMQPGRPDCVDKHEKETIMIDAKNSPCLLRPFIWIWNFIAWIVGLTGRLLAVVLGAVIMILGIVLTITIVGAIIGIPLVILGLLIIIRGLW